MKYEKLSNYYKITSGGTPSRKKDEFYLGGEIPWVKTGDLKSMYLEKANEFITEKGLKQSSAKLFPKGTVLIAMYGATIGNSSILSIDAATNQACAAFLPTEAILPEYLYYFFLSIKSELISKGVGGAQPNISISILKNIDIPYCSIDKQRKIVSVLSLCKKLIDKRKAQLEALNSLSQSLFIEMFGDPVKNDREWDIYKLSSIVKEGSSISYGIVQPGDDVPNGVPIIRPVDIQGEINLDSLKRTTNEISKSYSRTILKGNELLITVRGSVGNSYIVDERFKGFNVTRGITPLSIDEQKVDNIYLYCLFNTVQFQRKFSELSKGITLLQINMKDLRELEIPVPPYELQVEFSKVFNLIEKNRCKMETSLRNIEKSFNALMQQAFKGELFNN